MIVGTSLISLRPHGKRICPFWRFIAFGHHHLRKPARSTGFTMTWAPTRDHWVPLQPIKVGRIEKAAVKGARLSKNWKARWYLSPKYSGSGSQHEQDVWKTLGPTCGKKGQPNFVYRILLKSWFWFVEAILSPWRWHSLCFCWWLLRISKLLHSLKIAPHTWKSCIKANTSTKASWGISSY